jgi:hypothetical protein
MAILAGLIWAGAAGAGQTRARVSADLSVHREPGAKRFILGDAGCSRDAHHLRRAWNDDNGRHVRLGHDIAETVDALVSRTVGEPQGAVFETCHCARRVAPGTQIRVALCVDRGEGEKAAGGREGRGVFGRDCIILGFPEAGAD